MHINARPRTIMKYLLLLFLGCLNFMLFFPFPLSLLWVFTNDTF